MSDFSSLPFEIVSEILHAVQRYIFKLCLVSKLFAKIARGHVTTNGTADMTSADLMLLPSITHLNGTSRITDEGLKYVNLIQLNIYSCSMPPRA